MKLSFRVERFSLRRCKGCGREWPGHLEHCRLCPAVLGDSYGRDMVLVVPEPEYGELPPCALPVAVLALELSGAPDDRDVLNADADHVLASLLDALPDCVALQSLPNGALVAIIAAASLAESAAAAARAASAIKCGGRIERRAGIATGVVYGSRPAGAAVVALASRLARASQAGQTLCGYGTARLLDRDWQFAPAGILPRRQADAVDQATAFLGPKPPAPTPSAFALERGAELVGRASELAALEAELARARAGEARWCALVAPAGVGKSALLRHWLRQIDADEVMVAGAAATAFGQAPRAVLDELLTAVGERPAADMPADQAGELFATALERAAAIRPLLVLIDDLHWADTESIAILHALSKRPPSGCLVVIALRASFAPAEPWLLECNSALELPTLTRDERETLVARLLPGQAAASLRARLVSSDAGGNPLYLEQAVAYLEEAGSDARLPRSLHEAVLRRLELLHSRVARHGYERSSPEQLMAAEQTIGEWLDRLETHDFDSREDIAEYLSLLEQTDATLVISGSIAGIPQRRNRRLVAAIERFYTASFNERVRAIERVAERDLPNAAHAATRGAERALATVRLDDATGYLELAARLTRGKERARHLLVLGDALFARGLLTRAWRAYTRALRAAEEDRLLSRCRCRLAHVALARGRPCVAGRLLAPPLPGMPADERLAATCDLLIARAAIGAEPLTKAALEEREQTCAGSALVLRTRLRIALLGGPGYPEQLAHACAAALTLEAGTLSDLAALIETTILMRRALPALAGPALLEEAVSAARRLGNASAEAALLSDEPEWFDGLLT
jgi:tetratricopeptide (TPR) repeat protein